MESRVADVWLPKTEDDIDGDENGCSGYIKNLGFKTRDAHLEGHFNSARRKRPALVKSVRPVKVGLKRGREGRKSEELYMGFRFAKFGRAKDAVEAVKVALNTLLDWQVWSKERR